MDLPGGFWGREGDIHGGLVVPQLEPVRAAEDAGVNHRGTFADGLKISDTTLDRFDVDYKSIIRFRPEVREDAVHVDGLTLFGNGFRNYGQGIKVRTRYSPMESARGQA